MVRCLNLASVKRDDMCKGCKTAYRAIYVKPSQEYLEYFHWTASQILRSFPCSGRKKETRATE